MNEPTHQDLPDVGWGTQAEQSASAPSATPTGWATLRRAMFWSVLVLGVAGVGLGLYAVADDMSDTTDDWHGFGIALGLLLAVPCLCLSALAGFGLRSMRRLGAGGGRPHAIAMGMLLLVTGVLVTATPVVLLPAAVGAALVATVWADRTGRRDL